MATVNYSLPSFNGPDRDTERRRALINMRRLATGLFVAVTVLYAFSVLFHDTNAVWPFLGAFAEAAMVGALADWFAVTALFRYPLGLPFPHTAIIPKSRERIAVNLGDFVQDEFFSSERVQRVYRSYDPVKSTADWLADPARAELLTHQLGKVVVFVIDTIDQAAVRSFLMRTARDGLANLDLSSLGAIVLRSLTRDNRHQALLDEILRGANTYLNREQVKTSFAAYLKQKIPLFVASWKESLAMAAIDALLSKFADTLDEVDRNPSHPLRRWFGTTLQRFMRQLEDDPQLQQRIRQAQVQLVNNEALTIYIEEVWRDLDEWLKRDLLSDASTLRPQIVALMTAFGTALRDNHEARAAIDAQVMRAMPGLLEAARPHIGRFIAEKVREWEEEEIVEKLELNIGRDLQFIRLNGTVIGGLIGVLIHLATLALNHHSALVR
jgi:uncharacterized membrane-anchored protein YjiN (DUF445 family)